MQTALARKVSAEQAEAAPDPDAGFLTLDATRCVRLLISVLEQACFVRLLISVLEQGCCVYAPSS